MKTITFYSETKWIPSKKVVLLFALFAYFTGFAQLQNNGAIFIGDNATVYLSAGNYIFGTGTASTQTTRTSTTYGKLIYASGAGSSGATSNHFINGYAQTLGTSPFTMFVGQSGVLAPVRLVASASTGVDAAFYKAIPVNNLNLSTGISEISDNEYWDIRGVNSLISLSWRAATIANLTSSLYTIVGYHSTNLTWDIIPSTIDVTSFLGGASTPSGGSVTSTANVNLSNYRYFTVGSKGDPCAPLVNFSGTTLRWTGTAWVNNATSLPASVPSSADGVIIDVAYNTTSGSFSCNVLTLNADITIRDGAHVDCVNGVTGSGKVILESEGSFVQRNNTATAPTIELRKRTRLMRRFDYIYWGTPLAGNFFSQIATARANSASTFSPLSAFDLNFRYVSGPVTPNGWQTLTNTTSGVGFITRVRQQIPFTAAAATDFINLTFSGTTNNGTINVPISRLDSAPTGALSHNLLGNPYPSAIDADKFLTLNTNVDGVIYIWTAATAPSGAAGSYSQADYISYTRLGTADAAPILNTFTGSIASGQGFKVRSLVTSGTATFNNCMRLITGNNQFFRPANQAGIDRFKLNLTGNNGVFSQILIGYTPETTLGYDRMFDAGRNSVATIQLYSMLDNTTEKLAINARPPFTLIDKVALGIRKNNTNPAALTLTLANLEGVFTSNAIKIYLFDKIANTYHNLKNSSITFTASDLIIENRYEIVYQNESDLSNPTFTMPESLITLNYDVFKASSSESISEIIIFDLTGRIVEKYKVNKNNFESIFSHEESVYIAKLIFENGATETKKLIHIKK